MKINKDNFPHSGNLAGSNYQNYLTGTSTEPTKDTENPNLDDYTISIDSFDIPNTKIPIEDQDLKDYVLSRDKVSR